MGRRQQELDARLRQRGAKVFVPGPVDMAELLLGMGPVGVPLELEAPGTERDSFWFEGSDAWTVERLHGGRSFYTFCLDPSSAPTEEPGS